MEEIPLKCVVCSETCPSQDDLAHHYANHNPPIRFHVCDFCHQGFYMRAKLEQHMKRHKNMLQSVVMQEVGQQQESHTIKTRRRRAKSYACNVCGKTFDQEAILKRHHSVHKNKFRQTCDICGKEFTEKIFFEVHCLTHRDQKPFRCNVCGKVFMEEHVFLKHWKTHKVNKYVSSRVVGQEVYICDICREEFTSSGSLERHVKNHDPFRCDICLNIFKDRPTYLKHLNSHKVRKQTGTAPEVHTCTVCRKVFNCRIKLRQHSLRHDPDKPYGCEVCGKYFDDENFLKSHRSLHEKKVRQECDVCGKVFMERIFFDIHRLTHFEQKPFRCDICEDIFTDKTAYLRHRNNHKIKKQKHAERFLNMREILKQKLGKAK